MDLQVAVNKERKCYRTALPDMVPSFDLLSKAEPSGEQGRHKPCSCLTELIERGPPPPRAIVEKEPRSMSNGLDSLKDGPEALRADGRDNPLTHYLRKADELVHSTNIQHMSTRSTSYIYSQGGTQEGLMVS